MTFTKRLEKLQALLQARSDVGPVYCRRMEDEDEADALERLVSAGTVLEPDRDRVVFIVRAIIDPPERPAEQLPALTTSPSPRTVQGTRMAEPEIRRQLTYPPLGIA